MITYYDLEAAKNLLNKGYIMKSNVGRILIIKDGILYARSNDHDYYESNIRKDETKFTIEDEIINHPKHYTNRKYECIDIIEDITKQCNNFEAYLVGTILKYLWRWKSKNGLEDLKKAQWYLNKLIDVVGRED